MPLNFWAGYALKLGLVALVLGALYALVRGLTRWRARGIPNGRLVSVIESTVLSPHAMLHVVRAGTRYLLIGTANAGLATLAELTPADADTRNAKKTPLEKP